MRFPAWLFLSQSAASMVQAEEVKPSLIPLHMAGLDVIAAQSRSAIPLASGRCAGARVVGSRSIANGEVEIEDHEPLTVEAAINHLIAVK
ncbi:hypothetical protein ACIQUG_01210 [Ensifer sp. NPDC090286]|uniref:hypothetical protein n=1 Tax=Ensifer sp. NPDC090286 TaxID=3363991 RepID=UPI00383A7C4A